MQTNNKKTKKKVGILTFHFVENVGAMLQAYALQKVLNEYVDCKLINYKPEYLINQDFSSLKYIPSIKIKYLCKKLKVRKIKKFFIIIKNYIVSLFNKNYYKSKKKYKAFQKFLKNFPLTKTYYSKEDINCLDFDLLLVGSDQIWNRFITNGKLDDVYFLNFEFYGKRCSYAASAGQGFLEDDKEYAVSALSRFDYVSVREFDLREQIESYGLQANIDVDPTFLLDVSEYANLEEKIKLNYKYVLFYGLEFNEKTNEICEALYKQFGQKIVLINPTNESFLKFNQNFIELFNITPGKFLTLIKNASFVISSSFHGIVFSIIYKKNFKYISGINSIRVESLLNCLQLEFCNYDKNDNFINEIDYKQVDSTVKKLVQKSKLNLEKIIE